MVSVGECPQKAAGRFYGTGVEKAGRFCLHRINQGFSKSERLKKALSFKRLFKEGRYYKGGDFSLRVLENNLGVSRLGISVQSKIFRNAVQRNKIKRLVREIFRKNKVLLNSDYDMIVRPQSAALLKLNYGQIEMRILDLFKTAKIVK